MITLMSGERFPPSEFDDWAASYDADVQHSAFPFSGYAGVLRLIFELAAPRAGMDVLDLGAGTGNLAALFARAGCRVRGLDFSARMLEIAARKLPGVTLAQGDLRNPLPAALDGRYDALVSGYTFHHFPLGEKVDIARRLLERHARPGAPLLVGDIAFADAAAEDALRRALGEAWEQEEYWLADAAETAFAASGMRLAFTPVSNCAGVFRIFQNLQGAPRSKRSLRIVSVKVAKTPGSGLVSRKGRYRLSKSVGVGTRPRIITVSHVGRGKAAQRRVAFVPIKVIVYGSRRADCEPAPAEAHGSASCRVVC